MNYGAFGCKYANIRMCRVCKIESVVATNSIQCSLRYIFSGYFAICARNHHKCWKRSGIDHTVNEWLNKRAKGKKKKTIFLLIENAMLMAKQKKKSCSSTESYATPFESGMVKMEGKKAEIKNPIKERRENYMYISSPRQLHLFSLSLFYRYIRQLFDWYFPVFLFRVSRTQHLYRSRYTFECYCRTVISTAH